MCSIRTNYSREYFTDLYELLPILECWHKLEQTKTGLISLLKYLELNMEIMDFCNHSSGKNVNGSNVCPSVTGATIVSPTLMFLAGVLGNIFALCALHRTRMDVRATQFYTLVTALAWTDLLGIIMTSPSTIAAYVNGRRWAGGMTHCRYHGFVMTCFGLATPVIICAMAIERVFALKCVFLYSTRCRNTTARGLVVALWIGILWYGVLPFFEIGHFELQYPGTWCFLAFHTNRLADHLYGYIYASFNLLAILVMTSCNIYVMFTLLKAKLLWGSEGPRQERLLSIGKETSVCCRHVKQKHKDAEVQMIVLLCALTTVFALCWSPLMIQIIVTMATGRTRYIWDLTAVRLASFNQTLDPWLYILLRRSFCVRVKRVFKSVLSIFSMNKTGSQQKYQNEQANAEGCQPHNSLCVFSREKHLTVRQDSKPDLIDVINSECIDKSQLPDVTATRHVNSDCERQIHIDNNNVTDVPEKGIYVQFVILLQNRSSIRSNTRSNTRSNYRSNTRSSYRSNNSSFRISVCKNPIARSHSSDLQSAVEEQSEKYNGDDDCQNSSGVDTKETLMTDLTKSTRGSL